ncbi:MAG: HAD domain-containing protein [Acidiferrobacterales bacterium]
MKVIFLDIDGVLNSDQWFKVIGRPCTEWEDHIDPQAVLLLNLIIEKTGAKIVLSSSWRAIWAERDLAKNAAEEMTKVLSRAGGFLGEIVGCTPFLWSAERGLEIAKYLEDHWQEIEEYVAIDDITLMDPLPASNVVTTSWATGMLPADADRAIRILSAQKDPNARGNPPAFADASEEG